MPQTWMRSKSAVILRFWLVHHRMYEHVVDYSRALLLTNGIWLFCIVAIPFPTELIGRTAGQGSVGNGLYIALPSIGLWALLLLVPPKEVDRRYLR